MEDSLRKYLLREIGREAAFAISSRIEEIREPLDCQQLANTLAILSEVIAAARHAVSRLAMAPGE